MKKRKNIPIFLSPLLFIFSVIITSGAQRDTNTRPLQAVRKFNFRVKDDKKKAYKNLKIEKEGTRLLPIVIVGQPMSKLVTYTSYKAENVGRKVVLVNPKDISKMCSNCGILVEKDLLKKLISILSVAYLLALILMLQKIFSDWDYNLFVKSMDALIFMRGVITCIFKQKYRLSPAI